MQSILITGKDKEQLREAAQKICLENKISRFDIEIIETEKNRRDRGHPQASGKVIFKALGKRK